MSVNHYYLGGSYTPKLTLSARIYNFDKRTNININTTKHTDAILKYHNTLQYDNIYLVNKSTEPGVIKVYVNENLDTNSINVNIISASIIQDTNISKCIKLPDNFIQSINYDKLNGLIEIYLGTAVGIESNYGNLHAKFLMTAINQNTNMNYNYLFNV